jgi:ribonuclease E
MNKVIASVLGALVILYCACGGPAVQPETVFEAPVVETPVVETPVAETPEVEAPVAEAPAVEEPAVEATTETVTEDAEANMTPVENAEPGTEGVVEDTVEEPGVIIETVPAQ